MSSSKFPKEIKSYILTIVEGILSNTTSDQEINDLLTNIHGYSYLDDEEKLIKSIIRFVNQKNVLPITNKNIIFCYPSTFPIEGEMISSRFAFGGKGALLIDFFEDFIRHTITLFLGKSYTRKGLNEAWNKFEKTFFAEEVEVLFVAHLARFYYHAGGIIEELIPEQNIKIRYLHPYDTLSDRAIYSSLKKGVESSYKPLCAEEFNTNAPIVIEYRRIIKKNDKLENFFLEVSALFEKIIFLLRLICGGSVHFGFIQAFLLGNFCSTNHLIQSYPANHLFANHPNITTLDNGPFETWIQRAWEGIKDRDIAEWKFAIQKLRDSYSRISPTDRHYHLDTSYQLVKQLERLVDLIQALENTIGDYGFYISEYVAKIVARGDTDKEDQIKDVDRSLYILRDKYLHGKPTGRDSVESTFQSKFEGKVELLKQAINGLEYHLKQVLLASIMNPDLKNKIAEYHQSLGRPVLRVTRIPANPQDFPTLNSIYY